MKHIFLLYFTFCLLCSLHAQNPYAEQNYPWLNLQMMQIGKFAYNTTGTYEYNNDQTGQLVLIVFSQNKKLTKTFGTYEFYE